MNYQAGRPGATTPSYPSYFFKPPSTVSGDGATVERPQGCELLAYEARSRSSSAAPLDGWTPAPPGLTSRTWPPPTTSVYDLRYADQGSNVHSKGWDGCTPLGPLTDAADLDPAALRIVTRVNGRVVQDGRTDELLFSLPELVADVSSTMTLEPGDIL